MNNILKRLGVIAALALAAFGIANLAHAQTNPPAPADAYVDSENKGRSGPGGDYVKANEANQVPYVEMTAAEQANLSRYYAERGQQAPVGLTNARFLGRSGYWRTPYGTPAGGPPPGHQY